MAYDTTAAAAAAVVTPKDIAGTGKKKRVNRSAKLKQFKRDARREQWLSQVKNKDSNSTFIDSKSKCMDSQSTCIDSQSKCIDSQSKCIDSKSAGMNMKGTSVADSTTSHARPPAVSLSNDSAEVEREDPACHDSSDSESMTQSPTSGSECGSRDNRRPARSFGSSSGSSAGTSSWNVSDEELEDGEDGALDDWEAVADALTAVSDSSSQSIDLKPDTDRGSAKKAPNQISQKPEPIHPPTRAWRPDDASRPMSLPNLSKHRGFMSNVERQRGLSHSDLVPPISCPICCEDLDATDVSFRPCPCGFCLCLFCHKRILEEDARCPGCRKQYNPLIEQDVNVGGGTGGSSIKLSRSCSMRS